MSCLILCCLVSPESPDLVHYLVIVFCVSKNKSVRTINIIWLTSPQSSNFPHYNWPTGSLGSASYLFFGGRGIIRYTTEQAHKYSPHASIVFLQTNEPRRWLSPICTLNGCSDVIGLDKKNPTCPKFIQNSS